MDWWRISVGDRKVRIQRRIAQLVEDFPHYLGVFEKENPFSREGQFATHRHTIDLRYRAGSVEEALSDRDFIHSLWITLQKWGIGSRGSRLVSLEYFTRALRAASDRIVRLEDLRIDQPLSRTDIVSIWDMVQRLGIVENKAKLVPGTKALHHILPDLVVPIDRMYTQSFFGLHNPEFQYGQDKVCLEMFKVFNRVACSVEPHKWLDTGWNSSRSKIIDNAIVGYCRSHGIV